MASCRILDTPGYPKIGRSIIRLLCFILICATVSLAQDSADPELAKVKQLFKDGQWQEIAERPPATGASSDAYFYYGSALARLQRWDDAHNAFESGFRIWPADPRFSTELAGVAFK